MNTHVDKSGKKKISSNSQERDSTDKTTTQIQGGGESALQFVDNRKESVAQLRLQEMSNNRCQAESAAQLKAMADNYSDKQPKPIQKQANPENIKKENNTGLPDNLKTGMENLSGISLDDVKVHRNSDKPAQLQAHAYAQGTDIHLASGQEKHLPHEAWHVVQQKQGRVKPTMQMKGKVNINDDASLEKEADQMGEKSLNAEQSNQEYLTEAPIQTKALIQRKIAYSNPDEWLISIIQEVLKEKMYDKREQLFDESERPTVEHIFEEEFYGKLFFALKRLSYSKIDYGSFNLDSVQHILSLYYEIKKQINKPADASDPETEEMDSKTQLNASKKEQADYFSKSPYPGLTFKLAVLGAGAGAAYYLTSIASSIDPLSTIVIGEKQPWAEQRGPGVINHPSHMITAIREEVGLGDEELMQRQDFSEIIEEVINKYVIHRKERKIGGVTKVEGEDGEMFYQIDVDGVMYYAQNVVASLGIGPHSKPRGGKDESDGRAIDMDEFQRKAAEIAGSVKKREDITVVVGGGNAGIDAVMTAIRYGFKIIWATGSQRPKLLPGTDNEVVEEAYEAVLSKNESSIYEVIKKYANGAKANTGEGKPIIVNTDEGGREADYFVYALGPKVSEISNLFDEESIRKKLVPTYDKNSQFGDQELQTVVGLEVENQDDQDKTSLEIIGGTAFRMAGSVTYDYMSRMNNQISSIILEMAAITGRFGVKINFRNEGEKYRTVNEVMRTGYQIARIYQLDSNKQIDKIQIAKTTAELPRATPIPDFSNISDTIAELDMHPDLNNLRNQYLGSIRFIEKYAALLSDYSNKVHAYLTKKEGGGRMREADPRTAVAHTEGVLDTLPRNVAVNDQLTPIRSQVEANEAFVPKYVTDDVNFATDSKTVIAIYIVVNYPYLTDAQVDMWVDRVIRWRNPSDEEIKRYPGLEGPIPNPHKKSREDAKEFSQWFKKRLGEENAKNAPK